MTSHLSGVLALGTCRSVRQGVERHWTARSHIHRVVPMVFLLSGLVVVGSSYSTWAAVYQCLNAAGKTVLSNKQSELHKCRVLSAETTPVSTPPASMTPQGSTPAVNSEIPPAPPVPPMTVNRPGDFQDAAIRSQPPPNPAASSSPAPLRRCAHGLNPLNPLSSQPCVGSDQSGAKPSEAAPIQSQ